MVWRVVLGHPLGSEFDIGDHDLQIVMGARSHLVPPLEDWRTLHYAWVWHRAFLKLMPG